MEYSLFLKQLFTNITEGAPPDAFFWMPTEAIKHGGYTSPRKVRPDEPPPAESDSSSAAGATSKQVDMLTLDETTGLAIESHEDEPVDADSPRSPLRGGRRGGFRQSNPEDGGQENDFAEAASRLAATPRPKSSSSGARRAVRMMMTDADVESRLRVGSRSEAARQAQSPFEGKGSNEARWNDSLWHRPITASKEARLIGIRPNTSCGVAGTVAGLPPSAGMSAAGLAGGIATRGAQAEDEAILFGGSGIGMGRRPTTGAPSSLYSSTSTPVRMRSSLPQASRKASLAVRATTTLFEMPVSSSAARLLRASAAASSAASSGADEAGAARPSAAAAGTVAAGPASTDWQNARPTTGQLPARPPTSHAAMMHRKSMTPARQPLLALRSNSNNSEALASLARRELISREFRRVLRTPKAPGMGANVVRFAYKQGPSTRGAASLQSKLPDGLLPASQHAMPRTLPEIAAVGGVITGRPTVGARGTGWMGNFD